MKKQKGLPPPQGATSPSSKEKILAEAEARHPVSKQMTTWVVSVVIVTIFCKFMGLPK